METKKNILVEIHEKMAELHEILIEIKEIRNSVGSMSELLKEQMSTLYTSIHKPPTQPEVQVEIKTSEIEDSTVGSNTRLRPKTQENENVDTRLRPKTATPKPKPVAVRKTSLLIR